MGLEGERIRLREERPDDVKFLTELRNDLDTQAWPKALPPDFTPDMLRKRYEAREFSVDPDEGRFVIEERETGIPVGFVGYSSLERRHAANLGVMVAKRFWGTGYAQEANELLLRFMFHELGLRVVRLWTHTANPRAIALAERLGFRVAVRMRDAVIRNGRLADTVGMDLLREEFYDQREDLTDRVPDPFIRPESAV